MKTDIRVCVGGSRHYENRQYIWAVLDELHAAHRISCIIEGGQRGADRFAREWAIARAVPYETYDAEWTKYGIYAGGYRNSTMLLNGKPDIVLAFPTGGPGTNNLVVQASRFKIPFKVCA